jgi:hypothetical protein
VKWDHFSTKYRELLINQLSIWVNQPWLATVMIKPKFKSTTREPYAATEESHLFYQLWQSNQRTPPFRSRITRQKVCLLRNWKHGLLKGTKQWLTTTASIIQIMCTTWTTHTFTREQETPVPWAVESKLTLKAMSNKCLTHRQVNLKALKVSSSWEI